MPLIRKSTLVRLDEYESRIASLGGACSDLARRIHALEASHPPADTSVSPEPRSADSGPENARHEEEIADLKRQLSASRTLALRLRGNAELLRSEVQSLRRALAERDQTISAMRLVTCADQRVAGLETELANARAEVHRLEGVVEQQRLAIIGHKARESRDLEDARKWRDLVSKIRGDE